MVDAAAPEHRGLSLRFAVPVDLEHVELGVRTDVDHGQAYVGALGCLRPVARHGRVEHLLVERVQPLRVLGEDRHVVEPVEQHARQRTRPIGREAQLGGAFCAGAFWAERSPSCTCASVELPPRL